MAPARRQSYARSRSRSYNNSTPTYAPAPPPVPNQDLMPPSSRYLHNLRVIQRHDPSITSIFDQFPHVCVYHHKGDEWKKKGCEGAMFLFEREEEPKYGFYILNRNNTGDYIQRMTPDDDVEFASAYLIYRAFGKVTSDTIGLWTMVTQDREAMSQVMMRLHSYIKRKVPYPEEFRRRPDTWSTTPAPAHAEAVSLPYTLPSAPADPSSTSMSSLSVLLAKLGGPPESPPTPSPPSRTVSASVPPPATGIPLLDSIFASASTSEAVPPAKLARPESSGENVFHALFANGITVNGTSSASTSCGPTPTQHVSKLPGSSSPSKRKPLTNGAHSAGAGRSVSPHPHYRARNGRETAPPSGRADFAPRDFKGEKLHSKANLGFRRHSDQHQQIPVAGQAREDDDDGWEEDAVASVSVDASEGGVDSQLSSRKNKARKAKKRERERERKRMLKRKGPQDVTTHKERVDHETLALDGPQEGDVEWPLVDDRSLSVDDDEVENDIGLGDGLLTALAAVSEPELPNLQGPAQGHVDASKRAKNKERGKDRWKRKHKDEMTNADTPAGASEAPSHPVDLRNVLLDVYGHRRRVGDPVLNQTEFAQDIVELILHDSTFVQELHQQYLRRVQL